MSDLEDDAPAINEDPPPENNPNEGNSEDSSQDSASNGGIEEITQVSPEIGILEQVQKIAEEPIKEEEIEEIVLSSDSDESAAEDDLHATAIHATSLLGAEDPHAEFENDDNPVTAATTPQLPAHRMRIPPKTIEPPVATTKTDVHGQNAHRPLMTATDTRLIRKFGNFTVYRKYETGAGGITPGEAESMETTSSSHFGKEIPTLGVKRPYTTVHVPVFPKKLTGRQEGANVTTPNWLYPVNISLPPKRINPVFPGDPEYNKGMKAPLECFMKPTGVEEPEKPKGPGAAKTARPVAKLPSVDEQFLTTELTQYPHNAVRCQLCFKWISTMSFFFLTQHVKKHSASKKWRCAHCVYQSNDAFQVRQHMQWSHRDPFNDPERNISPFLEKTWEQILEQCFPGYKPREDIVDATFAAENRWKDTVRSEESLKRPAKAIKRARPGVFESRLPSEAPQKALQKAKKDPPVTLAEALATVSRDVADEFLGFRKWTPSPRRQSEKEEAKVTREEVEANRGRVIVGRLELLEEVGEEHTCILCGEIVTAGPYLEFFNPLIDHLVERHLGLCRVFQCDGCGYVHPSEGIVHWHVNNRHFYPGRDVGINVEALKPGRKMDLLVRKFFPSASRVIRGPPDYWDAEEDVFMALHDNSKYIWLVGNRGYQPRLTLTLVKKEPGSLDSVKEETELSKMSPLLETWLAPDVNEPKETKEERQEEADDGSPEIDVEGGCDLEKTIKVDDFSPDETPKPIPQDGIMCQVCNRVIIWRLRSSLGVPLGHAKRHYPVKQFSCDRCEYASEAAAHVRAHQSGHLGSDFKVLVTNSLDLAPEWRKVMKQCFPWLTPRIDTMRFNSRNYDDLARTPK